MAEQDDGAVYKFYTFEWSIENVNISSSCLESPPFPLDDDKTYVTISIKLTPEGIIEAQINLISNSLLIEDNCFELAIINKSGYIVKATHGSMLEALTFSTEKEENFTVSQCANVSQTGKSHEDAKIEETLKPSDNLVFREDVKEICFSSSSSRVFRFNSAPKEFNEDDSNKEDPDLKSRSTYLKVTRKRYYGEDIIDLKKLDSSRNAGAKELEGGSRSFIDKNELNDHFLKVEMDKKLEPPEKRKIDEVEKFAVFSTSPNLIKSGNLLDETSISKEEFGEKEFKNFYSPGTSLPTASSGKNHFLEKVIFLNIDECVIRNSLSLRCNLGVKIKRNNIHFSSVSKSLQILSKDMEAIFLKMSSLSDVLSQVTCQNFETHKALLYCRCPFLFLNLKKSERLQNPEHLLDDSEKVTICLEDTYVKESRIPNRPINSKTNISSFIKLEKGVGNNKIFESYSDFFKNTVSVTKTEKDKSYSDNYHTEEVEKASCLQNFPENSKMTVDCKEISLQDSGLDHLSTNMYDSAYLRNMTEDLHSVNDNECISNVSLLNDFKRETFEDNCQPNDSKYNATMCSSIFQEECSETVIDNKMSSEPSNILLRSETKYEETNVKRTHNEAEDNVSDTEVKCGWKISTVSEETKANNSHLHSQEIFFDSDNAYAGRNISDSNVSLDPEVKYDRKISPFYYEIKSSHTNSNKEDNFQFSDDASDTEVTNDWKILTDQRESNSIFSHLNAEDIFSDSNKDPDVEMTVEREISKYSDLNEPKTVKKFIAKNEGDVSSNVKLFNCDSIVWAEKNGTEEITDKQNIEESKPPNDILEASGHISEAATEPTLKMRYSTSPSEAVEYEEKASSKLCKEWEKTLNKNENFTSSSSSFSDHSFATADGNYLNTSHSSADSSKSNHSSADNQDSELHFSATEKISEGDSELETTLSFTEMTTDYNVESIHSNSSTEEKKCDALVGSPSHETIGYSVELTEHSAELNYSNSVSGTDEIDQKSDSESCDVKERSESYDVQERSESCDVQERSESCDVQEKVSQWIHSNANEKPSDGFSRCEDSLHESPISGGTLSNTVSQSDTSNSTTSTDDEEENKENHISNTCKSLCNESTLSMKDIDPHVLYWILRYIYSGRLDLSSKFLFQFTCFRVYVYAMKYGLNELASLLAPLTVRIRSKIKTESCSFKWTVQDYSKSVMHISPDFKTHVYKARWNIHLFREGTNTIVARIIENGNCKSNIQYKLTLSIAERDVGHEIETNTRLFNLKDKVCIPDINFNLDELGIKSDDIEALTVHYDMVLQLECLTEDMETIYPNASPGLNEIQLSRDLRFLFRSKSFSDISLRVGDENFYAHRFILSARSSTFATMLKATKENVLELEDIDGLTLECLLLFIYTAEIEDVKKNIMLYKAAVRYSLSDLQELCRSYIVNHLSKMDACEVLIVAHQNDDSELESVAQDYVCKNAAEMLLTKNGLDILTNHISIAKKILSALSVAYSRMSHTPK